MKAGSTQLNDIRYIISITGINLIVLVKYPKN